MALAQRVERGAHRVPAEAQSPGHLVGAQRAPGHERAEDVARGLGHRAHDVERAVGGQELDVTAESGVEGSRPARRREGEHREPGLLLSRRGSLLEARQHQSDLAEGKPLAQEFLDKTRLRFSRGPVARLDVIKAQVDYAQAENALIANGRDLANARAALNRLLGRLLGAGIEPADTLAVPPALPALARLDSVALGARPELASLKSQQAGARAATSLAKEFWLPDLGLSVTKNFVPGAPATYTSALGFSFPLFFWNHTGGEVAEASHHERELDATYRDLEAQVDEDVRTTYATAATALEQAVCRRDQLVPEARQAYDIASTSYGLGGSSALEVLDARRTLLDAESQYAEALGAANDARADLERAIGMPLDSIPAGGSQ